MKSLSTDLIHKYNPAIQILGSLITCIFMSFFNFQKNNSSEMTFIGLSLNTLNSSDQSNRAVTIKLNNKIQLF